MSFLRLILRRFFLLVFLTYKHFLRNFISTSGLFLTLFIIFTMLAVLRPLKNELQKKFQDSLPVDVIRVTAKETGGKLNLMGFFSGRKDYKMGVQSWQLKKIKEMRNVSDVEVTSVLQMPLTGTLDEPFFKNVGVSSELLLQGVSYKLAKPYLKCQLPWKNIYRDGIITLPLLIPDSFASIIQAFALMNGLPSVTRKQMLGLKLKFELGNSTIPYNKQSTIIPIRGVVCGFAPANIVAAVGVPYAWVHRMHYSRGMKKAYRSFDQVFVFVKNRKNMPQIKEELAALNLQVPQEEKSFDRLLELIGHVEIFFTVFAFVLGLLSLIAMSNAFMLLAYKRKYEFGLYLVFGSSASFIWILMIFQGVFFAALHCFLAFYAGEYAFQHLHDYLQNYQALSFIDIKNISFQLSKSEKTNILLIAMMTGAISSLLPSLSVLGTKTIRLIRRDS